MAKKKTTASKATGKKTTKRNAAASTGASKSAGKPATRKPQDAGRAKRAGSATPKASDLMTTDVVTIGPTASLGEAARLMWDRDCGIVPVVDVAGILLGVVTDRDVCMGGMSQRRALGEIPVAASMAVGPRTCGPDADLDTIHGIMREHRVRRLPVVDESNRVQGILSLNDLVTAAFSGRSAAHKRRQAEVAASLEAIGRPRAPRAESPEAPER